MIEFHLTMMSFLGMSEERLRVLLGNSALHRVLQSN